MGVDLEGDTKPRLIVSPEEEIPPTQPWYRFHFEYSDTGKSLVSHCYWVDEYVGSDCQVLQNTGDAGAVAWVNDGQVSFDR